MQTGAGTSLSDISSPNLLQAVSIVFLFLCSPMTDEMFLDEKVVGGICDVLRFQFTLVSFFFVNINIFPSIDIEIHTTLSRLVLLK